jgi:hypothetical protein
MILIIGQGIAIFLYFTAESIPPDLFNPLSSKRYIRELELYGGKFNVLAAELSPSLADQKTFRVNPAYSVFGKSPVALHS